MYTIRGNQSVEFPKYAKISRQVNKNNHGEANSCNCNYSYIMFQGEMTSN